MDSDEVDMTGDQEVDFLRQLFRDSEQRAEARHEVVMKKVNCIDKRVRSLEQNRSETKPLMEVLKYGTFLLLGVGASYVFSPKYAPEIIQEIPEVVADEPQQEETSK